MIVATTAAFASKPYLEKEIVEYVLMSFKGIRFYSVSLSLLAICVELSGAAYIRCMVSQALLQDDGLTCFGALWQLVRTGPLGSQQSWVGASPPPPAAPGQYPADTAAGKSPNIG